MKKRVGTGAEQEQRGEEAEQDEIQRDPEQAIIGHWVTAPSTSASGLE